MTNSIHWAEALKLALKNGWNDEEISRELHGLVTALDALSAVYPSSIFDNYLGGSNAFLDHAKPIDLIRLGNHEVVLRAIAQEQAGGYA